MITFSTNTPQKERENEKERDRQTERWKERKTERQKNKRLGFTEITEIRFRKVLKIIIATKFYYECVCFHCTEQRLDH